MFGKDKLFALDDQMNLRVDEVEKFIKNIKILRFLSSALLTLFGNIFLNISVNKISFDLNNGILFHGGGWKKIESEKFPNQKNLNQLPKTLLNLNQVHDYYGMVEQTGSIYVECSEGFPH